MHTVASAQARHRDDERKLKSASQPIEKHFANVRKMSAFKNGLIPQGRRLSFRIALFRAGTGRQYDRQFWLEMKSLRPGGRRG